MSLAPGPHREWRRCWEKCECIHVGRRRFECINEVGIGVQVPLNQIVIFGPEDGEIRPELCEFSEIVDPWLVMGLSDVSRGPQVDFDQMPDQIAHVPTRTRRDFHVEATLLGCFGEEFRFLSNDCDVLGNLHNVLPNGPGEGPTTSCDLNSCSGFLLQLANDVREHL